MKIQKNHSNKKTHANPRKITLAWETRCKIQETDSQTRNHTKIVKKWHSRSHALTWRELTYKSMGGMVGIRGLKPRALNPQPAPPTARPPPPRNQPPHWNMTLCWQMSKYAIFQNAEYKYFKDWCIHNAYQQRFENIMLQKMNTNNNVT